MVGRSLPIVLYRRLGDGYCYDAFQSEELRQRLFSKDGQTVIVEYNIFSELRQGTKLQREVS